MAMSNCEFVKKSGLFSADIGFGLTKIISRWDMENSWREYVMSNCMTGNFKYINGEKSVLLYDDSYIGSLKAEGLRYSEGGLEIVKGNVIFTGHMSEKQLQRQCSEIYDSFGASGAVNTDMIVGIAVTLAGLVRIASLYFQRRS